MLPVSSAATDNPRQARHVRRLRDRPRFALASVGFRAGQLNRGSRISQPPEPARANATSAPFVSCPSTTRLASTPVCFRCASAKGIASKTKTARSSEYFHDENSQFRQGRVLQVCSAAIHQTAQSGVSGGGSSPFAERRCTGSRLRGPRIPSGVEKRPHLFPFSRRIARVESMERDFLTPEHDRMVRSGGCCSSSGIRGTNPRRYPSDASLPRVSEKFDRVNLFDSSDLDF